MWQNMYNVAVARNNARAEAKASLAEDVVERERGARDKARYSVEVEAVNAWFNEELQRQIDGTLPEGHVYYMGRPGEILLGTGIANVPIQLSSTKLKDKSSGFDHDYDLLEVKDLVKAINNPLAVFKYGNEKKAQNIVVEIQHNGKNFIVGLAIRPSVNGRVLEINSIRNVFPKDNAEWLNWIQQGKLLYADKEKIQTLIDQQRTNLADVEYLDLDSVAKILNNFENPQVFGEKKSYGADTEGEKNGGESGEGERFSVSEEMGEEIYRGKTLKEISNIQYAKAQEVLKALHDAGYKDFKISRSITDFGVSTYIQGKYGLKFRISDHGVTSTRRMWDEVPFGLNTDTDFFVDVVKEAQEEAKKRGKELEERREKERRLDEKWDRIKPQFEGLGFKTNRRTYQSLEEFTANGKRSNVLQTPVEGGAFKYEWTEPIDEHTKEKPSYEWLERFDEGEENARDNDVRYSLDDKKKEREEKTLMGVHNISEEKLKKAIKNGGLANPSMAVIDTKNNRKLLDAVTYDDEGNVIPLSKRFDSRKSDVRYAKKAVGGNSGYVGYSKSKRAVEAENRGLRNASQMNKEFADEVNALLPEGTKVTLKEIKEALKDIKADEWHHTSKFGNKTNYYSAETIAAHFTPETEEQRAEREERAKKEEEYWKQAEEKERLRDAVHEAVPHKTITYGNREIDVFETSDGHLVEHGRDMLEPSKIVRLIPKGEDTMIDDLDGWAYEHKEEYQKAIDEYNEAKRAAREKVEGGIDAAERAKQMDEKNGTEIKRFVDFLRRGELEQGESRYFHVGETGDILNKYGINGKITVGSSAINTHHSKDDDHLDENEWVEVIDKINEPIAITRYGNADNSYRIYTIVEKNGKNVCVGVDVNSVGRDVNITNIKTAFAREIANALNEKLVYPENREELEKAIQKLSLRHNREVYPEQPKSAAKVRQNSESTKFNLQNADNEEGGESEAAAKARGHAIGADEMKEHFGGVVTEFSKDEEKYLGGIDDWRRQDGVEKWIPFRDVYPQPTLSDYYMDARGTFEYVGPEREGKTRREWEAENANQWWEMRESGKYEYHESPMSPSEYLTDKESGDIYRYSDHWGNVGSCRWNIDVPYQMIQNGRLIRNSYVIGKINIGELRGIENGRYYASNDDYYIPAYKVAIENIKTFLTEVKMTDEVRKRVEDWLKQYEKGLKFMEKGGNEILDRKYMFREGEDSYSHSEEERNGMVERAEALGAKLGTAIRVVDDVESLQHSDPEVLEKMKKAKGWYDRVSGRVTIVPGNIEDVEDAVATVMHEVVGHKGMRELVGKENYDRFLDAVYGHLTDNLKREIDERVGRTFIDGQLNEGGRSYEEVRREAVDEVIAEIAEKQPEEMSERERSLWEKICDSVRKVLDKFLRDLDLPSWVRIGENEIRYMLWREKEWQEQVSSLKLNIGVFYKSTFEIKIIQYEQ